MKEKVVIKDWNSNLEKSLGLCLDCIQNIYHLFWHIYNKPSMSTQGSVTSGQKHSKSNKDKNK